MKLTSLPATLLASLLCLPSAFAQDAPPAAASDAVTLEQLPDKLQKLDDEIARKLEEVRTLVDSELAAKRLTEPIAQSLRWSLRTTATVGSAVDVRGIVSTMRVPTDNGALTQAVKELEATYAAAQVRRTALASETLREVRRRVAEMIRIAAKPADLEALEKSLATANEALRRRTGLASGESTTAFSGAEQTLRGLRRLLQAEVAGKPAALGQAINQMRNDYGYDRGSYENEAQARFERLVQPFATAAENAETQVAAAISGGKPKTEIEEALARLDETTEALAQMKNGQNGFVQGDVRQAAANYRVVAKGIEALSGGGDEIAQNRLNEARNAMRQLGAKRAVPLETIFSKLEKENADAVAKMASERGEKLPSRIAAVKQPADLEAIIADVRNWSLSMKRSDSAERDNWNRLAAQLSTLNAAWATAGPAFLQQQDRYGESEDARAGYARELTALRKRIERDVLSRVLEAPELNTPPLSEKPVEAAFDAFCDDLVKKSDWRRLYDVLNAQAAIQVNPGRRPEDDTLTALRSFFSAQNLELAEQWVDAAQTYKAVLRSASRRAPIVPAADRLKALVKAHPEISAAARSVSPEQ